MFHKKQHFSDGTARNGLTFISVINVFHVSGIFVHLAYLLLNTRTVYQIFSVQKAARRLPRHLSMFVASGYVIRIYRSGHNPVAEYH
jgi:hypothetical protein